MSQSRQYLTGLCFVLLVAMAITPTITNAETATTTATSTITAPAPGKTDVSSLLILLNSLMKQVEDLQKQLAQVRTELKDGLHEGMTDEDVKKVQELLATDPTLYPKGLVTGYYGPMTKEAIMRFQTRHGLEATGEINAETKALMLEYFKEKRNGHVPEGLLRTQGIGDQMKLRIKTREIECEQKNGVTFCKNREGDNKGKNRIDFNSTSTINNNIECEQEHGQMVCKSHNEDEEDESDDDEDGMEDEDEDEDDKFKKSSSTKSVSTSTVAKDMKKAKKVINDAKDAIADYEDAKDEFAGDNNVSLVKLNKAYELLKEAEDAFDAKAFKSAIEKAEEAKDEAEEGIEELNV